MGSAIGHQGVLRILFFREDPAALFLAPFAKLIPNPAAECGLT
jgi:hypothetical protein